MRRLLIVAASAVVLLAIGFGAELALRNEAGAPEQREQSRATQIFRLGPTTITCGIPPYKPCATASEGSTQIVLSQEPG